MIEHDEQAAAERIRASLAPLDQATLDRIVDSAHARLGEPGVKVAKTRRFAPARRVRVRIGVATMALAATVAIAVPVDSRHTGGRGSLGPDLAAADVLDRAAEAISSSWNNGADRHDTVTSETARMTVHTERWLGADGSSRERVTIAPTYVPSGTTYWVPAETCATLAWRHRHNNVVKNIFPPAGEADIPFDTLPVGASAPRCWTTAPTFGEFAEVVGPIVAAPPTDAPVETHSLSEIDQHGRLSDRMLRYGQDVVERPVTGDEFVVPQDADQLPVPRATTWVPVRAVRGLAWEDEGDAGSADEWSWTSLVGSKGVAALPTTTDGMLAALRAEASRSNDPKLGIDDDAFAAMAAIELLSQAPISGSVARATLRALAALDRANPNLPVDVSVQDDDVVKVTLRPIQPMGPQPDGSPLDPPSITIDVDRATVTMGAAG